MVWHSLIGDGRLIRAVDRYLEPAVPIFAGFEWFLGLVASLVLVLRLALLPCKALDLAFFELALLLHLLDPLVLLLLLVVGEVLLFLVHFFIIHVRSVTARLLDEFFEISLDDFQRSFKDIRLHPVKQLLVHFDFALHVTSCLENTLCLRLQQCDEARVHLNRIQRESHWTD